MRILWGELIHNGRPLWRLCRASMALQTTLPQIRIWRQENFASEEP